MSNPLEPGSMSANTPFGQWLRAQGHSLTTASDALALSRSYVSSLAAGTRLPSITAAKRIAAWTENEVPVSVWVPRLRGDR